MKRIALLLALAASALAGGDKDAQKLLAEMTKRWQAAPALTVRGTIAVSMSFRDQKREFKQEIDLRIARPLHGRITIASGASKTELVAAGDKILLVDHQAKQFRPIASKWLPVVQVYPMAVWCTPKKPPEMTAVTREQDGAFKLVFKDGHTEWLWFDDKGGLAKAKSKTVQGETVQEATGTFKTFEFATGEINPADFAAKPPEGYGLDDPLAQMNAKLLKVGDPAPDVSVTRLDGTAVKLSDLKGKTVLLNFWFFH